LNLDKNLYPRDSQVFLTVNDFQLNQDPTDANSWTFNINSTLATFYQAYGESGSDSEFIGTLKQMVNGGIIVLPKESAIYHNVIPTWVKNNAKLWVSDQISDDEFINSIQYLIKKGILVL